MRTMFIAALCCSYTAIAQAQTAPAVADEVTELRAAIADLQQRFDQLQASVSNDWLTEQRAEEIRGLVQDVLADADTRASLLQARAVAGWDNGFFLASGDGNYLLKIGGQLQVRAVYNTQDESPVDDDRYGFEIRRAKLFFTGFVVDPTWEYAVEVDASRSNGAFTLGENGWIQKNLGNGWYVLAGQFKPPFLREETISSRRLLTVERSLVNSQFTAGTAQGVLLTHRADRWRAGASFTDGRNSRNTPWEQEDAEYAFTARFDWLAMGDWKAVEDDIAFGDLEPALLFGAAVLYQQDEFGTGNNLPPPDFNNAENESLGLTADVTAKFQRISLAAAVVYESIRSNGPAEDLDQLALVLRGGVFVADDLELYAMFEWGDLDMPGVDDLTVVTLGATKYWARHALKWQNDIGFGINPVAAEWATESAGWRADAPDQDGQIVVRSQIQLLF